MGDDRPKAEQVEALFNGPDLADALESNQFRRFLDQIPIAILVSELKPGERIVYANPEFERLSGQQAAGIVGKSWDVLNGQNCDSGKTVNLGEQIASGSDFVGTFKTRRDGANPTVVDAYSNVIEDNDGTACYRLAALVDVSTHDKAHPEDLEKQLREKDILLREIQHRVKNNLQMITALIRIEARNARGKIDTAPFDRLAGRIEAIQLVYKLLADHGKDDEVDLGIYLSEIASSVLRAHAVEGIRLDLKVDVYPVSVNVAMPAGLVVNELLINALKHAFVGRDAGTITLHSLSSGNSCRVTIADDGIGLSEDMTWPKHGKLSALIVQSLRENARAQIEVISAPGEGMRVTILFTRADAAPE